MALTFFMCALASADTRGAPLISAQGGAQELRLQTEQAQTARRAEHAPTGSAERHPITGVCQDQDS